MALSVKNREGRKSFNKLLAIRDAEVAEVAYTLNGKPFPVVPSLREMREASKLILAYCWGLPTQSIEHSGAVNHHNIYHEAVERLTREFQELS